MSSSAPETRPATTADTAAVADVLAAFETDQIGRVVSSAAEVPVWWSTCDLATSSWLVERDGRLDAVAWVGRRGDAWDAVYATRPGSRELEPHLLELCERRVREIGGAQIRATTFAVDEHGAGLLAARGYRPVRHFYEMRIEHAAPPAEPVWPDGIRPAPFRPEDARAFYDASDEAFAEEWGFHSLPFDEWKRLRVDESDTSFYVIAWDGDDVAGIVRCEVEGSDSGFVGMLGVRRAWRGRGIGEALLRHVFAELYRAGRPVVSLGVDSENPTGATRLYERVGMRIASEDVVYEKELT